MKYTHFLSWLMCASTISAMNKEAYEQLTVYYDTHLPESCEERLNFLLEREGAQYIEETGAECPEELLRNYVIKKKNFKAYEIIKDLLEKGLAPQSRGKNLISPLGLALRSGNYFASMLLLRAGASPDYKRESTLNVKNSPAYVLLTRVM